MIDIEQEDWRKTCELIREHSMLKRMSPDEIRRYCGQDGKRRL